jgi:hypothetical protein
MDEDTPQPEPEKPRFLLPDGCKDLIDAFPKPKPAKRMMYFWDQDGNSLGPPKELSDPKSVPDGLSALPGYVSRLFTPPTPFDSLTVFTVDDERGFGLARQGVQTHLLFSPPPHNGAELEQRVRAFFAVRAIAPARDYLANEGATRCIDYLLPQSSAAITTICRELLTDCFGVQPNDALHFLLDRVD